MRKSLVALAMIVALCVGYVIWPFASLFDIVRAARAGDVARIEERLDVPALRRSFTAQLVDAYARVSGKSLDRGGVLAGFAGAFADPLVERLVTSRVITELMQRGWSPSLLPAGPSGVVEGLDPDTLGSAWWLYLEADYGIGEVRFPVPVNKPKELQYRVRLALDGLTWKLAALDLPQHVQEHLVREFMKHEGLLEKRLGALRSN
jgi:hypothetical protein